MAKSLFFYDLETTGLNAASSRIMQFAGQRTNLHLELIGPKYNYLIKLDKDVLPEPQAILVHGITPQQTLEEGLTEAEFLKLFYQEIITNDTTFVGFNNLNFDDNFIRNLNYRNLYDPYAWAYANNCSRWDILGLVLLTRALRPEGINWPVVKGKMTNRLQLLTEANNLEHLSAHDAYSDVMATIEVANLIRSQQPKLFSFLFNIRQKEKVAELINNNQLLVYIDNYLPSELLHTTIITKIADGSRPGSSIAFDLRNDPSYWLNLSNEDFELAYKTKNYQKSAGPVWPFITIKYNSCPVIAPMSVVNDEAISARLSLNLDQIEANLELINQHKQILGDQLNKLVKLDIEPKIAIKDDLLNTDRTLYDGFISQSDLAILNELHRDEDSEKVRALSANLSEPRLKNLAFLYLARNYYADLSTEEIIRFDDYLKQKLFINEGEGSLKQYFNNINLSYQNSPDTRTTNLLEDLRLYGESLIPTDYS